MFKLYLDEINYLSIIKNIISKRYKQIEVNTADWCNSSTIDFESISEGA